MLTPTGHYSLSYMNDLHNLLLCLQEPFCKYINLALCRFIPVTCEERCGFHIGMREICESVWLLLLAMGSFPLFLLFFPLWCSLQFFADVPFKYITSHQGPEKQLSKRRKSYTVCSGNLCLIPEVLLRYNNQKENYAKAREIGRRIAATQRKDNLYCEKSPVQPEECSMEHSISETFPANIDVLCIQEAFHMPSSEIFVDELRSVYPHIIYDVGTNSLSSNLYMMNSGLLIASRFPILAAKFYTFPHAHHYAYFTATGLLLVKILLGTDPRSGRQQVALVGNTHLQAYQGTSHIHQHQLDDILKWLADFRKEYFMESESLVFDVMCGDFNIDNLSPVDESVWDHGIFWGNYTDPCMVEPGEDLDWTIGTEFRTPFLHSPHARSPADLRKCLLDPCQRRCHLLDGLLDSVHFGVASELPPADEQGKTLAHKKGGRRRVDRITYRHTNVSKLFPQKFYFITHLATLTDHIPVALTFRCECEI